MRTELPKGATEGRGHSIANGGGTFPRPRPDGASCSWIFFSEVVPSGHFPPTSQWSCLRTAFYRNPKAPRYREQESHTLLCEEPQRGEMPSLSSAPGGCITDSRVSCILCAKSPQPPLPPPTEVVPNSEAIPINGCSCPILSPVLPPTPAPHHLRLVAVIETGRRAGKGGDKTEHHAGH